MFESEEGRWPRPRHGEPCKGATKAWHSRRAARAQCCSMNMAGGECPSLANSPPSPALGQNGFKMRPKHLCLGQLSAERCPFRTAVLPDMPWALGMGEGLGLRLGDLP